MYKSIPGRDFLLETTKLITPTSVNKTGKAYIVDQTNFKALQGITCYTLEVWDESMRLPHWHPNASELGYIISGSLQIFLWRSPGETAVFTLTEGMCWFIPQGALHSLNNVGDTPAQLLVGFSSDLPEDIDLPVAWNGIPVPLRNAYTSPHEDLANWKGPIKNPLVGKFEKISAISEVRSASPYEFDFAKVPPLFASKDLGSVVWGIRNNWNILENISVLRATLHPGVARDAIWYPDAGTLYVVAKGAAEFHLVIAGQETKPFTIKQFDYVFVPQGVLHTFINTDTKNTFEIVAFFTKANPLPEISLSVATAFFPHSMLKSAMTQYGSENLHDDPLKHLNYVDSSPYLISIKK